MSKVQRKEYQETKITKTVSPTRSFSSQNLSQFDSNLDYLLDDLQNSVSRPGSSLAINNNNDQDNYRTNGFNRANSLNRVLRVNAANPTTEYSSDDAYSYSSPDGRKRVEGYKKESYSYKTTSDIAPERVRVQKSINQLDSLLDDLKEAKKPFGVEKDNVPFTNGHSSTNLLERNEKVSSSVKKELHYGDTPKSSTYDRRIEKEIITNQNDYRTNEGFYSRTRSSSPPSRTSTLSRQMKVKNVRESPIEIVETTCPEINPEILEHLDPSLRPPENTKVTTTIKTYTYEIPGSAEYKNSNTTVDSSNTIYKNTILDNSVYRNASDTSIGSRKYVYSPINDTQQTTPSKSFVYEKVENIEKKRVGVKPDVSYETKVYEEKSSGSYKPYKKPNPPGFDGNVVETITTRNYQPGYPRSDNESYVYNETITTKNLGGYGTPPVQKKTYIVEEMIDERIDDYPIRENPSQKTYIVEKTVNEKNFINDYPVRDPPRKETYIYKETHNTIDRNYPDQPRDYIERDITRVSSRETNTNRSNEPPYRNGYPGNNNTQPLNIKYKYTSTSSTTNNFKSGYPQNDEGELLLPRPFPTEERVDGPPKKIDELMNTIGREPPNSPLNAGFQQHERDLEIEKRAKTLKKQQATEVEDLQRTEPPPKSKNVSGPPVYYPPGEMFAKKEEGGGGGWRAEGAYAREAGKYEYESESNSKSKSKSGAAIVPVCLPLCCGLPCTII